MKKFDEFINEDVEAEIKSFGKKLRVWIEFPKIYFKDNEEFLCKSR
jgi:hypothetical protein